MASRMREVKYDVRVLVPRQFTVENNSGWVGGGTEDIRL